MFAEHQALFYWLTGASVVMFVGSLAVLPVVLVRMPADYFSESAPAAESSSMVWKTLRNVAGAVLVLIGLALLLLPGQGILMILIGVMLADFPGKQRIERWIISRKKVLATANWLRHKFDKPPLKVSDETGR